MQPPENVPERSLGRSRACSLDLLHECPQQRKALGPEGKKENLLVADTMMRHIILFRCLQHTGSTSKSPVRERAIIMLLLTQCRYIFSPSTYSTKSSAPASFSFATASSVLLSRLTAVTLCRVGYEENNPTASHWMISRSLQSV